MSKEADWEVDEIIILKEDYDLSRLPVGPLFINLLKLSLQASGFMEIPSTFFEHMPLLEELDLSTTNIQSLPSSISSLTSLQKLFLRDCSVLMELPSKIGMLTKLKLLDCEGSEIMYIPKEIGELSDLEVLRVSLSLYADYFLKAKRVNDSVKIPRNILLKLNKLKELCITTCPEVEWWEEEVKEIQDDLCHLEYLESLKWYLPTKMVLDQFLQINREGKKIYENLSNFTLTIGRHPQLTSCLPANLEKKFEKFEKCLKWINAEGNEKDISMIMERAEALFLSRHWTIVRLSDFDLPKLKYCLLAECNEMETLVKVDELSENFGKVGLESIEYLTIHHMEKFQCIWNGPMGKDSLSRLRILALHVCPKLTTIFTINIAQNLSSLTELTVEDCPNVRSLISNESANIATTGPLIPCLEKIFLLDLPDLESTFRGKIILEKVDSLLVYNCLKLQYLSVTELPNIQKIKGEREWWNDLKCDKSRWQNVFEQLKEERKLIKQLAEATNSLQCFNDILSRDAKGKKPLDRFSLGVLETKGHTSNFPIGEQEGLSLSQPGPKLPLDLFDADHPVGIEPRTQDLISKLGLGDPDPSITTAVFAVDEDSFSSSFDNDDDEPFHCCKRPKHDVFLSYSNEDIGKSFVSRLKGALQRYGFDISDHTCLPISHDESSELLKAIEESWICVVVFSIEYPFSVKCLDELVLVMDSISKSNNRRRVFPIFYNVDPSHVQNQQHGSFLQAFQAHYHNHVDGEKVEKWKHALKYVGNLAGQVFQTGENEEKFVRKIVKMLGKLKLPVELSHADHPVGIKSRARDLISRLRLGDPDPSITAVLGMSGSGKTTLVKAVYDRIVPDFDANCFIENISYYKHSAPNWKVVLQHDVISRFTGDDYPIHNVSASSTIRNFPSNQKVLLVLDDVDKYEELQALGIHDPASFAPGSRILVTTTNKQSLSGLKRYTSYNIVLLNHQESSELFTRLAYEKGQSADKKFVDEIVRLAGGVPFILDVWGRYFKSHERKQWPTLLEKLRRNPHEDVQWKLKVSYDSLSPRAKDLFLDIACFFDGMEKDLVIKVLQDEDNAFFSDIEIENLIDRGLVEENEHGKLRMHAVIREMGREVVRQENEDDPGQRSRLVGRDVIRVLRDCSGTDSIRSIYLEQIYVDEEVTLQVEALRKMSNLRYIMLPSSYSSTNDEIKSPLCFKHLKYLEWWGFPFKCLDKFDMENVVAIVLYFSKLETLWEGASKSLKKLRILDVYGSEDLNRTGSFIGLENLEKLVLLNCGLKKLDDSICCLQNLVNLDLTGCRHLKTVPWEKIDKLTSATFPTFRT